MRSLRGGGGCPCGGVVVNGLCRGLADGRMEVASGGGGCPCGGVAVNGLCHGLADGKGWRAVSTGFRQAQPPAQPKSSGWGRVSVRRGGGQRTLSRTRGRERMEVGFDRLNHQLNPRLRGGGGCPCGGVVVNGLCHPAKEQRGRRSRGWERREVASGWGRVSVRRGGEKPSTNERPRINERCVDEGRFRQGFDTASLVNHQLNPRLRGGGGCPCGGVDLTLIGLSNRHVRLALSRGERVWA